MAYMRRLSSHALYEGRKEETNYLLPLQVLPQYLPPDSRSGGGYIGAGSGRQRKDQSRFSRWPSCKRLSRAVTQVTNVGVAKCGEGRGQCID